MKKYYSDEGKRAGFFEQVIILTKKNFLIQRRHPWVTLLQFLIPALLGSLLQIGRAQVEREKMDKSVWRPFDLNNLYVKTFEKNDDYFVVYTPENDFTTEIVEMTCTNLTKSLVTYNFMGMPSYPKTFKAVFRKKLIIARIK